MGLSLQFKEETFGNVVFINEFLENANNFARSLQRASNQQLSQMAFSIQKEVHDCPEKNKESVLMRKGEQILKEMKIRCLQVDNHVDQASFDAITK